jgi:hypothetical protein
MVRPTGQEGTGCGLAAPGASCSNPSRPRTTILGGPTDRTLGHGSSTRDRSRNRVHPLYLRPRTTRLRDKALAIKTGPNQGIFPQPHAPICPRIRPPWPPPQPISSRERERHNFFSVVLVWNLFRREAVKEGIPRDLNRGRRARSGSTGVQHIASLNCKFFPR